MTAAYRDDGEQLRQHVDRIERDLKQALERQEDAERERDEAQSNLRGLKARSIGRQAVAIGSMTLGCAIGAFLVCLLGWWVQSCANDRNASLTAGVVVDRYFTPAHTTHGVFCHPVGKVTVCTPTSTHHDDVWRIRFDHDGASRVVEVTQSDFEDSPMGSWFRVDGSREPEPAEEIEQVEDPDR